MKIIAIIILSLFAMPLFAGEIDFHGPAWNDLSIPLGITSYYVEVNSDQTAKSVGLVLEIYKQGKLVRTIRSFPGGFDKEFKLNVKFGIYFVPKPNPAQGYTLTFAQKWLESSGSSKTDVPLSDIDLSGAVGSGGFTSPVGALKMVPLFCIVVPNPTNATPATVIGDTVDDCVKENPDATVLIGYLERK
ncbi:MAG: hypothetical protein WCD79_20905 [Chthoniobacteraceae bacterium]